MKKEILNKPNQLISILPEKSISLVQQKSFNIVLRTAQQIVKFSDDRKYKEIDKEKRYIFKIPCRELKEKAGLDKQDYKYIKNELEKLMKLIITVVDKENKDNWSMFHLLEKVEKEDENFKFFLDGFIVKALKEHDFFTSLDLMQIRELNSKYSVFFYELAIRYQRYKIPKMSLEELKQRTNTEDKYKEFYDFRKRVLDVACEEISQKTDINLSYTTEKRGRRIAFIDFKIEKKKEELPEMLPKALPVEIEVKEKEYSPQVLELFKLLPLSEQVESNKRELAKLLKDHSFRYLKADIDYAKSSKPDNFMGFIKASCQSNHYSSAELEKEEQKKELARKREEKKQRRKEMEDKIRQKAKEKAIGKYEQLSSEELKGYGSSYNSLPKILKGKVSKQEFIMGAIEEEMEKEIREIREILVIMNN